MSPAPWRIADFEAAVGTEIGLSRWLPVPQSRIDAFADVTEDRQFIHVDPAKAAQSAYGGTVAHGFLTLSLLSTLAYDGLPAIAGATASVNYGFDRIRFIAPVLSGAQIRARFRLGDCQRRNDGHLLIRLDVTVEIEGQDRPALTGEWIILHLF